MSSDDDDDNDDDGGGGGGSEAMGKLIRLDCIGSDWAEAGARGLVEAGTSRSAMDG